VGDEYLLPTLDNRTFFYATGATLTALSVSELADAAAVEKLDYLVRQEWDTPEPYMAILPLTGTGAGGTPVDNVKIPDPESECFARCERLEARLVELAPPPPPPPPAPTFQDITLVPVSGSDSPPPPRKKPGSRRPSQT
jgi:hypothetical protein